MPVGAEQLRLAAVDNDDRACKRDQAGAHDLRAGCDLFIQQPQPFSGSFNKPDEDRFVLHIPTGSKPNVVSPPIFLKTAIADLIRDNWA